MNFRINFMKSVSLFIVVFVTTCYCSLDAVSQETKTGNATEIKIGTYDSRAIAVAWAASKHNPVGEKMKELKAAEKAQDEKKIAELKAWGPAHQRLLHFQGFGRVPVGDLLLPVKDQIKQLVKDQNLAAITMSCDVVGDGVKVVDVTMDLVQLFEPSEKTIGWVKDLRDKKPMSLLELADLPEDK